MVNDVKDLKEKNKISVIGSANFDVYIKVNKSPKIGETILANDIFTNFGGKGANQSITIKKLGGDVNLFACLGDDSFGNLVRENLKNNNIDLKYLNIIKDQNNGMAVVHLYKNGDNQVIVFPGANGLMKKELLKNKINSILISDIILTQLEIPADTVDFLSESKTESNTFILNPSPIDEGYDYNPILRKVDILIPNEIELEQLAKISIKRAEDIEIAADTLINIGVKNVVVTLGSEGVLVRNNEISKHIKAKKTKVVDTSGAGDIFAGAFCFHYAKTRDLIDSAIYANKAASLSVTKWGTTTAIPTKQEIENVNLN